MPNDDPFKGYRFPPGTYEITKQLYGGRYNVFSGSYYHRKVAMGMLWSEQDLVWHPWLERALKSFCSYNWVTWTGPAASSKSFSACALALEYWLEGPNETSVIMCSTTKEALGRRLWFYVQDLHSKIKPTGMGTGEPLYSEYMIRWKMGDKKNGIFGLAIEEGPVEEALHNLIGYHNKRVLLVIDECQGVREAIFRACDNLAKNPEFKALFLGNAESRDDPHGRFSEPIDGWISVDPDKDEQWETRGGPIKGKGCCVFFDGRRSPAITEPGGRDKYPFLINQEQIDAALDYHKSADDPRFWSQSIGFWPPFGYARTVLDEVIVRNNHVTWPATWYTEFLKCAVLDPSFEGGDRKVFLPFKMGTVLSDAGGKKWLIEFGEPIELKISVKDDQEIHYQILHQVVAICRTLSVPASRFALGSSGEGGGLYSIFRREWGPVTGIEEAGKVSERPISAVNQKAACEEYDRVVTELLFAVREFAICDSLRNMPAEAVKELCARKWEVRNKLIRVETKHELRKHFNRSPDYGDACAFAVELARRLGAFAGTELKAGPDQVTPFKAMQEEYDNMVLDEAHFHEHYAPDYAATYR
jgi:hypothetical protein